MANFLIVFLAEEGDKFQDLKDIADKIIPDDPWAFVVQLVATFFLVIILTFFLVKPVRKYIAARQAYIQNDLDEAKSVFEFLEDQEQVIDVVKTNSNELNFTISDEQSGKLKGGMMMSAPIVINGVPIASLALVGPKRIDYANVAAALKFIVNQIDKGGNGE